MCDSSSSSNICQNKNKKLCCMCVLWMNAHRINHWKIQSDWATLTSYIRVGSAQGVNDALRCVAAIRHTHSALLFLEREKINIYFAFRVHIKMRQSWWMEMWKFTRKNNKSKKEEKSRREKQKKTCGNEKVLHMELVFAIRFFLFRSSGTCSLFLSRFVAL